MKPTVISADAMFEEFRGSLRWEWLAGLGASERQFDPEVISRAQSAADLAALAAAGALVSGPGQSCSRAADVAEAMGSRVGQCSVRQLDVVIDVEMPVRFGRWNLGVAHGQARAGPGER